MVKRLDLTKPVQLRNGCKVRIYATDAGGPFPIHGAWYVESTNEWLPIAWTVEGKLLLEAKPAKTINEKDLINTPEYYYFNVYEATDGYRCYNYRTRKIADNQAGEDRVACVKFMLGQFDD